MMLSPPRSCAAYAHPFTAVFILDYGEIVFILNYCKVVFAWWRLGFWLV